MRWAENAVNKGGVWQTRPGYKTTLDFSATDVFAAWWEDSGNPPVTLQGGEWFTPTNSGPYLVWAVSGSVFASKLKPDGTLATSFQLGNVQFSPTATQVVFCRTVQTQSIVNGEVVAVPARNVLIMQDGGSRACFWDGATNGSLNPQKSVTVNGSGDTLFDPGFNETRIGLWMAWSGNRLFVSFGPQGFASDIGDPLHFTEELTLTSVPSINLPAAITGMSDRGTSGSTNSQCLIFTATESWAVVSGIQVRIPDATNGYPGWIGTPNFLSKIFAGTGCIAGKSVVNHRGLIYWLSAQGLVMFDSINTVTSTQNQPAINTEMAYSNILLGSGQVLAAAGYFDSYVFWSMGAGATSGGLQVNSQTQVLDRQPLPVVPEELFAWQGVWTGINPVQWATLNVFGINRCYAFSLDAPTAAGDPPSIRIYEGFQSNRADNGRQIPWLVETPLHLVADGIFNRCNFLYARAFMQNIYGNLDMVWRWKGTRGTWHEILTTSVTATPGSIFTPTPEYSPMDLTTESVAFLPQVRDILSRNLRGPQEGCSSSKVEARGLLEDASDRAFGMRFEFLGRGTLSAYRIAADNTPQSSEGADYPPETGLHMLKGDGCPEFIAGERPDYILAEDTANGAIVAFPTQTQNHFAAADGPYLVPQPERADATLVNMLAQLPCTTSCVASICSIAGNSADKQFLLGRDGSYRVRLRLAGVAAALFQTATTQVDNVWGKANTYRGPNAAFNVSGEYRLDISSPAQTYYLNYNAGNGPVQSWDYDNEVTIDEGASVTLSGGSPSSVQPCSGANVTVPNVPEVTQPYDGSFFVVQILDCTRI